MVHNHRYLLLVIILTDPITFVWIGLCMCWYLKHLETSWNIHTPSFLVYFPFTLRFLRIFHGMQHTSPQAISAILASSSVKVFCSTWRSKRKKGVPPIAGWFISWKIQCKNEWFRVPHFRKPNNKQLQFGDVFEWISPHCYPRCGILKSWCTKSPWLFWLLQYYSQ